jgi:HAD superfamily hydrolase (TIGR01450 family)/PhzF family phenazine biosynthesis protein
VRIRIIDAFTDEPFSGNPAAVCLLDGDGWPEDAWMRAMAAEINLSETAFACKLPEVTDADWALRWFTPLVEDELCGHATLATAHALRSDGTLLGTIRFRTRAGILTARSLDDGTIVLDFPAASLTEVPIPDALADALGARPESTFRAGQLRDLVTVFGDEATVRELRPDFAALAAITRREAIRGVTVTAASADRSHYDFVSRFFSPADGIPEDPVTGSAHTALAPFWSLRLGREKLLGFQASIRSGLIQTEIHGNRVHLVGQAVTVFDGIVQEAAMPDANRGLRFSAPSFKKRSSELQEARIVDQFDGFVVDLDGVVWIGPDAVTGAASTLSKLRARGKRLIYLTNDPGLRRSDCAKRLHKLGVEATARDVITVGAAAAAFFASNKKGQTAYVMGPAALKEELRKAGLRLLDGLEGGERVDLVIVGGHEDFDYEELRTAALAVRRGAGLYCTGRDPTFPMPDGPWPATGAIVAAVEAAAGRRAKSLGKPEGFIFELARQRLIRCARVAVIGDGLDSDIQGGQRAGLATILVLTGNTSRLDLSKSIRTPDFVIDSLASLT